MDEAAPLFINLSKDDHCDERQLYLSGYNGDTPYTYRTKTSGEYIIDRVVLSILAGIQPSKLSRFVNDAKNDISNDGFLQRFQGIVYPDKQLLLPLDKKGEEALSIELNRIFEVLDSLPSTDQTILRFDDEAQHIFDDWRVEETTKAHYLAPHLSAHVGKSYEFVASLSVYLLLYENNGELPKNNEISAIPHLGKHFP